jgi:hypothetical protein
MVTREQQALKDNKGQLGRRATQARRGQQVLPVRRARKARRALLVQ